ncbi:allantoicase [Arsenicitalea aurantiaca]|uniref:Probable allantoicase n=1 Tax=Arsenicitalea aurantiaca TaxID=1783274 RepID=A0A433XLI4_9HYPH|nr:allantoicase [Arsenicitalea aurantiaca]RUT34921.1 allantoicase [Arsenicitalea aurantiaca]
MPILHQPELPSDAIPAFVRNGVNLASAGLGAEVLSVSDDFFAEGSRMLADTVPAFDPDLYDDHGKYMDGWESIRKRGPGHDHAVVKLAVPGVISGFDVNTAWFTGNFPPACSIDACRVEGAPDSDTEWVPLLPVSALGASAHHFFACTSEAAWTHVRLNIYPDGGVARLRVYGRPEIDAASRSGERLDLASALNGGRVVAYSDAHYGNFQRMLSPGRGLNMGDGWETRRRRVPGNDWIILALGARGSISAIEVDTAHYKGNYPDQVSIQAADLGAGFDGLDTPIVTSSMFWQEVLAPQKLGPDAIHNYDLAEPTGPVTHVRVNIHPDGGISRLRLFGTLAG